MDESNEQVLEEGIDEELTPQQDLPDDTDWKAETEKLQQKAIAQRERSKEREKALKQQLADAKSAVGIVAGSQKTAQAPKTGGLDENALDFLDLKGITEAEDIKVIEDVIKKTGQTVRQVLKDDYVLNKLESNKAKREVKEAIPSNTKRSGGQTGNDLAAAIARYEQSGYKELPQDFDLRSAVVNAMQASQDQTRPSWRR